MRRRTGTQILCALLTLACADAYPVGSAPSASDVGRGDAEFADTLDLLDAIEDGTFAKRAGIAEKLEAATLPDPVKVEFVRGSDVPEDQREGLEALAARLRESEQVVVDLVGCSDPSGPEALNRRISQARAESVASLLLELGVAESQIGEVLGRGEDCEVKKRAVHAIPAFREQRSARAGG